MHRWVDVATSTFAFEMSYLKSQGKLAGKTAKARYLSFMHQTFWNQKRLRKFFSEYEELGRLITILLELWVDQTIEFLNRLEEDLNLLAETFNGGVSLGKIVKATQNMGDYHQGGRSVYHLLFECGKELYYKPKNLTLARSFHALLEELNQLGLPLDLKGHRILSRAGYGWEEKVEHRHCQNEKQVARYFERAGMLLCLLYLFDGTDIHLENIIAAGEYPILIDFETFFHSELTRKDRQLEKELMNHSVLKTALLPVFLEREGERGPDIGGLTGENIAYSVLKWGNLRTDELYNYQEMEKKEWLYHQVVCNNSLREAHAYIEEIVNGFKCMYSFIAQKTSLFTQKGGWIDQFAKSPVRIVFRSTRLYGYLLDQLALPHVILDKEIQKKRAQAACLFAH